MKFLALAIFCSVFSFSVVAAPQTYTEDFVRAKSPITGRDFFDYLRRLGISEKEVLDSRGKHWLSVGEGLSNFTAEAARRGVDSMALDAVVVNPHAPERSRIGYAQSMPFPSQQFDRVVAVWLMDLFFSDKHFNDPERGKSSLAEMIRVTKIGGDIRISPVKEPGLLAALEDLKAKGMIRFETLPYHQGAFKAEGKQRLFNVFPVETNEVGSVRVTRLK